MVVMEGERQSQGGQGWYEGGAGAAHPASPMPSAQLHQVCQEQHLYHKQNLMSPIEGEHQ